MRFVLLSCASTCLAFASLAAGCGVPDVGFFAADAAPDHSVEDAAMEAAGDAGPADGATGSDAPSDAPCSTPDAVPPYATMCCGEIPCVGTQCSNMLTCQKCAACTPEPGAVCCITKANTAQCWNILDAGPCPP